MKKYSLETPLCWTISKETEGIQLNRGEMLRFDLVKLKMDDHTYRFPSEQGWVDNQRMIIKDPDSQPIAGQYNNNNPGVYNTVGVPSVTFESIEWEEAYIKITSEESTPIKYDLEFKFAEVDESLPSPKIVAIPSDK